MGVWCVIHNNHVRKLHHFRYRLYNSCSPGPTTNSETTNSKCSWIFQQINKQSLKNLLYLNQSKLSWKFGLVDSEFFDTVSKIITTVFELVFNYIWLTLDLSLLLLLSNWQFAKFSRQSSLRWRPGYWPSCIGIQPCAMIQE